MSYFDKGKKGKKNNSRRREEGYGANSSQRSMFSAICDACGANCEVPFKPSSDKPIYCNSCFKGKSSNSRDFGSHARRADFTDKKMLSAVCDACGVNCEVPFRPTGNKPVYCDNCFSKGKEGSSRQHSFSDRSGGSKDFEALNAKLDQIIRLLENSKLSSNNPVKTEIFTNLKKGDKPVEIFESKKAKNLIVKDAKNAELKKSIKTKAAKKKVGKK